MIAVHVEARGPIFQGVATKLIERTLHNAVQEAVELGEQRLDEMLRPRPSGVFLSVAQAGRGKASTGHYRRSINGEVRGTRGRIDDSGVVYGPWLEGTSSRNATTRFKGYRSFRRTAQHMQKEAPRILRKHVAALVRDLS